MKITFTLETIDPAKAAEYLARNTGNRKPRVRQSEKLARDILSGKWEITHQPIAFDRSGRLIDGQHRLSAIIIAQATVRMYVARYDEVVEDTMYIPVDEGVKRTHADVLHLSPRIVQVCNVLQCTKSMTKKANNSSAEVLEIYERHGELIENLMKMTGHRTAKFRTAATVTASMVLTILNNPSRKDELEKQWRCFVAFDDLENLKPSFMAIMRYADQNAELPNRFQECICRSMNAFAPDNWGLKVNRLANISEKNQIVQEIANRVL